jgi:competence protein ComEC
MAMIIACLILGKRDVAFEPVSVLIRSWLRPMPSVKVRAAIMSSFALLARQVGRRQDVLNALAAVAAGMSVFNPLMVWEVGFQLSFMATPGAGALRPAASELVYRSGGAVRQPEPCPAACQLGGEYVLFTFAAQITTLPVLAYHFERISLVSLIANPFILPAQPVLIMVLIWLQRKFLLGCFLFGFLNMRLQEPQRLIDLPRHFGEQIGSVHILGLFSCFNRLAGRLSHFCIALD